MPGDDDGHPVRVAAYDGSPLGVITPADEELPRVQLSCDAFQLIRRIDFQHQRSHTDVASSRHRTAAKFAQHDDLGYVVPGSAHCSQLLFLGQQGETKHLAIEVNRSLELSHVHHDTLKVHPVLQISTRAETP